MTDLTFVGIALLGFAIIGGCHLFSTFVQAKATTDRERIEAHFEKRYTDKCTEADRWRLAYEEARIENGRLKARLEIQDRIYGTIKVKNIKGGKA